jgi:hypothetical protein
MYVIYKHRIFYILVCYLNVEIKVIITIIDSVFCMDMKLGLMHLGKNIE